MSFVRASLGLALVLSVLSAAVAACGGGGANEEAKTGPSKSGGLSPDQVRATVRANADPLLACRDASKTKRPVDGVVQVGWTIATDGRVSDVHVVESAVHDADVEACVVGVVERFSFPPSTAPTVIARLPFTLAAPAVTSDAGAAPATDAKADAGAPASRDAGAKPAPKGGLRF